MFAIFPHPCQHENFNSKMNWTLTMFMILVCQEESVFNLVTPGFNTKIWTSAPLWSNKRHKIQTEHEIQQHLLIQLALRQLPAEAFHKLHLIPQSTFF